MLYNYNMVKENLVFLPGWTKKSGDYHELLVLLEEKYKVYPLDLLDDIRPYNLADFAQKVRTFLKQKKIKKVILAGHSFGGRVAIKLTISNPELISKLILINSAGIERKNFLIKLIKAIKVIKPIKLSFLENIFGSKDYLKAKGNLQKTLVNIVEENLEPELEKIKVPTLIIWGREDHTTPLWMGKLMHKLIKNSQLKIIEGDHGIPYRKPEEVFDIIK